MRHSSSQETNTIGKLDLNPNVNDLKDFVSLVVENPTVMSQSRTVWTQEVVTYVDFSGVAPGQNYCAVANFSYPTFSMAASAKSSPQCVETVSRSGERAKQSEFNP